MNVRGHRLEALTSEGTMKAKVAARVLRNVSAYISSSRAGITITSIGLGWLGGPAIAKLIEPALRFLHLPESYFGIVGFLLAFVIIAAVHYVISGQLPNMIAMHKSEQVTIWSAAPIIIFHKLVFPFIWLLDRISRWMLLKTGIRSDVSRDDALTEEDIKSLVKESHQSGNIDQTELLLVDNVFSFTDTIGREIMIPRTELACLYANLSFEENLEITAKEMRTRYPFAIPTKITSSALYTLKIC